MPEPRPSLREISVEEFDEMIENHDELLIVDVREAAEFDRGHIPGALLIPQGSLDEAAAKHLLAANRKTLVLCSQDGARSVQAADKLWKMGFEKIYSLAGGINRWQAQGYALVRE